MPSAASSARTVPTGVSKRGAPAAQATEELQRAHDADEPMAAHAEVGAVVEEDDAGDRAGLHRRREQRADDGVVAARLTHDRAAKMVEPRAQIVAPLGHRGAGGLRPSVDHDARRLAFGVRVDDAHRARNVAWWRRHVSSSRGAHRVGVWDAASRHARVATTASPRHRPRDVHQVGGDDVRELGTVLRAGTLALACSAALGAQDTTAARRADTVTSAARAPRTAYVPKRSRADTLRGSYTTPGRRWWDVTFYDLHVASSRRTAASPAATRSPIGCCSRRPPRSRSTSWSRS